MWPTLSINFINMTVKHNNNVLNLITGCPYVSSFGLHVSVNFMTVIRSIRAKIYDMQQSFLYTFEVYKMAVTFVGVIAATHSRYVNEK